MALKETANDLDSVHRAGTNICEPEREGFTQRLR
jgi:hypothetical protein